MKNLLLSLAEIHITMAILVLILLLLSRFFGKRYSAQCRYLVWTVVILRFCIPIGTPFIPAAVHIEIPSPESIAVHEQLDIRNEESENILSSEVSGVRENSEQTVFYNVSEKITASEDHSEQITTTPTVPYAQSDSEKSSAVPPPAVLTYDDVFRIVGIVWLAVAVLMFVYRIGGYAVISARMKKKLRPATAEYDRIYHSLAEIMNIRTVPPLYISSDTHSPMLCGFFRPVVILPDAEFTEDALTGILSHELTHHKRHDLWVKLLCTAAVSLGWFDPLVYIAAARCGSEMELACDESVLRGLDKSARIAYGNTMLDIIRMCHSEQSGLTTHFNPRKSAVRERFHGILDSGSKKRGVGVIAMAAVLCVLAGAVIACTVDNDTEESNESDTEISETEYDSQTPETDVIPEAVDDHDYSYLDSVLGFSYADGVMTCSLLSDNAKEALDSIGRRDLTKNEINYIIESSIELYFSTDKIVFPNITAIFEELPTKEVEQYSVDGKYTVTIPDFPYAENLAYILCGNYSIAPIRDISDENLALLYSANDLNGDEVITPEEIKESKPMKRDSALWEIKSALGNIALYRILTFIDTDDLEVTEFTHSSGATLKKFTYNMEDDTLVLDDASGTIYFESDGEVIYPTAELEYEAILGREKTSLVEIGYLEHSVAETAEMGFSPVESSDIKKIVRSVSVDGVDIIICTTNDGAIWAASRQTDAKTYTRFIVLADDGKTDDYSIGKFENVLGASGFYIESHAEQTVKHYYIIENGAPLLYLSAYNEMIEDDCDNDGMIEVIQQSPTSLTVYDNAQGVIVTRDIPLCDDTGERVRYDETLHCFEFDHEQNEGEGDIRIRRGVLCGDLMKITDAADEWVIYFEEETAVLYYNAATKNCEGVTKLWCFECDGEQFVFKANAVKVGITNRFDYTRDGTKDWRICFTDEHGNDVYFQYDPETHEFYETELEETV